jgi:hypothetical protein
MILLNVKSLSKDCGSTMFVNGSKEYNMCFYCCLLFLFELIGINNEEDFYIALKNLAPTLPNPGIMVDTETHNQAIEIIAQYFDVHIKIFTSPIKDYVLKEHFVSFGNPSSIPIYMYCLKNHYIALFCDPDIPDNCVSEFESLKIITKLKEDSEESYNSLMLATTVTTFEEFEESEESEEFLDINKLIDDSLMLAKIIETKLKKT